jgi:tripartite-type tricarboxylate transporter receptor subunit TctC
MTIRLTRRAALATAAAAWVGSRGTAWAQADYPSRSIRVVIPFAAGGTSDVLARLVGQKVGESMRQPWVAENRPGAGGNLAAEQAARSAPDGYTLFLGFDGTLVINPHIYRRTPFDPLKDFAPITKLADAPLILVGRSGLEANTLPELLKLAAARPGRLSFGTAGTGSTGHLVGELIKSRARVNMVHVPYKGGSAALNDVLGGSLDLMLAAIPAVSAHLGGGKLKVYGTSSLARVKALANVPTFDESGLPGFDVSSWYGLLAPAATPAPIVNRIHAEVVKALAAPDMVARFEALGTVPVGNTPDAFRKDIAADLARWGEVVKAAQISAE